MVTTVHRHLHADVVPPVKAGANRQHDPVLGWRLVVSGRDQQTRATDTVRIKFLDHDTVKQGAQFVAHAGDANGRLTWDAALMATNEVLLDLDALIAQVRDAGAIGIAVMVTSADGRTTIDGRVGGLTGPGDQRVLLGIRELAAAVVVGGTTVRAEGYDGLLDEAARARRRGRGLPDEPELIVVERAGPDVGTIWRDLRERHPDGLIVCEGGPTVLGLVVEAGLLDELLLGISPMLVGGDDGKSLLHGTAQLELHLQVLGVAQSDGFLFVRYGITP